eukprot:tig00000492_g1423.t1
MTAGAAAARERWERAVRFYKASKAREQARFLEHWKGRARNLSELRTAFQPNAPVKVDDGTLRFEGGAAEFTLGRGTTVRMKGRSGPLFKYAPAPADLRKEHKVSTVLSTHAPPGGIRSTVVDCFMEAQGPRRRCVFEKGRCISAQDALADTGTDASAALAALGMTVDECFGDPHESCCDKLRSLGLWQERRMTGVTDPSAQRFVTPTDSFFGPPPPGAEPNFNHMWRAWHWAIKRLEIDQNRRGRAGGASEEDAVVALLRGVIRSG